VPAVLSSCLFYEEWIMKWFGMLAVVAMISLSSFAVEKDAKDELSKDDHDRARAEESAKSREALLKKTKSDPKDAKDTCVSDR